MILLFAVLSTVNPIMGASSGELGVVATAAIFGAVPAMFVVGGVFPARALGVGWARSVISSVVAVGVCCLLVPVISQNPGYEFLGQSSDSMGMILLLFLTVPPVLTMLLASVGPGQSFVGALAVLEVGAIQASLTFLATNAGTLYLLVGLLTWVSVPAIADLFQPRSDEPALH